MSNRPKHHAGSRSRPHLRAVPSAASPSRSPLREALEADGPGAHGVKWLIACVGSIDALEQLDIEPLPLEPFDDSMVAAEQRSIVAAVHAAMTAGVDALNRPFSGLTEALERIGRPYVPPFDEQYQAIAQRILLRLAARDPLVLDQTTTQRTAAAIVWLALRGNQTGGGRRPALTADSIWRAFGVSSSARLAGVLHGALGFQPVDRFDGGYRRANIWLADAELLHSTNRIWLIRCRSSAAFVADKLAREEAEQRPIQVVSGDRVQVRARPVNPFNALRAPDTNGRLTVVVMFGTLEDPEVIALTVPDARRLVTMLQRALDAPITQPGTSV